MSSLKTFSKICWSQAMKLPAPRYSKWSMRSQALRSAACRTSSSSSRLASSGGSLSLATSFYWYLTAELSELGQPAPAFARALEVFLAKLSEAPRGQQIRKELRDRGVDTASECRGCNEKSQFIEVLCRHM